MHLAKLTSPADLRALGPAQLDELCAEIRQFVVQAVSRTGGHLGSNLGAVELSVALHRVFESPRDVIIWDTGHQAYVHKLITGRKDGFERLRQRHGLSGYPSAQESDHDIVENSHASTSLSWASGLAAGFQLTGHEHRRVVAVIGDGSMDRRNDIRGIEQPRPLRPASADRAQRQRPLVRPDRQPALHRDVAAAAVAPLRAGPSSRRPPARAGAAGRRRSPGLDSAAAAMREMWEPPAFFETLGVRYVGPVGRARHWGHGIGFP